MRLFPAAKPFAALTALSLCLLMGAASAHAQQQNSTQTQEALAQALSQAALNQQPGQPVMGPGSLFMPSDPAEDEEMSAAEYERELQDKDSNIYKANALAEQAKRENDLNDFAKSQVKDTVETVTDLPTPPELITLQDIHGAHGDDLGIVDEEADAELLNLDIRRDAQREAALSYGSRGGYAKRVYQILERFDDYEPSLDKVFDFRALLVRAPSGLLIEPPIVGEQLEAILINADGSEAAVAERVLNINKQAKIVSAPRDWRHYLHLRFTSDIAPPPRVLWPKDAKEQSEWNGWVREGWRAGYEQGEESFTFNLNKLVSDYSGMVRYKMLLAQGMISQPYALHEDRGVTGDKTVMRVGDRALRITGPSQFLSTGTDLWKPADR